MFMGGISAAQTDEAFSAPAAAPAALAVDWILPSRDVLAWLNRARAGDRLLYGQGEQMIRGETSALLRALSVTGDCRIFQPRSASRRGFDFIAIKCTAKPKARVTTPRVLDKPAQAILARIERAAERDERCPSDAMLAALAGVTVDQAKWRLKKLARAGRIETLVIATAQNPRFRVVKIVATGAETARPPRQAGASPCQRHPRQPGAGQ